MASLHDIPEFYLVARATLVFSLNLFLFEWLLRCNASSTFCCERERPYVHPSAYVSLVIEISFQVVIGQTNIFSPMKTSNLLPKIQTRMIIMSHNLDLKRSSDCNEITRAMLLAFLWPLNRAFHILRTNAGITPFSDAQRWASGKICGRDASNWNPY